MKITTFEQLASAMERIDGEFIHVGAPIEVELVDYLKKSEASETYALKNSPVIIGSEALSAQGATWLELSDTDTSAASVINPVILKEFNDAVEGVVWIEWS